MKKILSILIVFSLVFIYSCDDNADFDTDDQLTGTATSGGAIVAVSTNSDGKLLGAPSSSDLSTATVAFSNTLLNLEVLLMSGGQNVASYEILKSINGGSEVVAATSPSLPMSLSYSSITEFIDGLGLSEDALRIGDVVKFRTKFVHNDGSVSISGPNDGTFNVTINCSADLSGTYLVTNDWCFPSFTTTISQNADGTWQLVSGDGGGLFMCTGNTAPIFANAASIDVVCGEVLPTDQLRWAGISGNNIGNITGGIWDGVNGVLTMSHTQTFTGNWPAEWNSTYTRQ